MSSRCFHLIAAGESYRLLFPLGMMLGAIGAMLWPAFVYGWLPLYPGVIHARIMIQGFVGCFLVGFLTSAIPPFMGVAGFSLGQTWSLACLIGAAVLLHIAGASAIADGVFAVALLVLLVSIGQRWPHRKDLPPPGFALVLVGILSGVAGSFLLAVTPSSSIGMVLGKQLLYQGFVLLPVLGASVYLLPRLIGLPNRQVVPMTSPGGILVWRQRAVFLLMCGVLMIVSFVMEAFGHIRMAYVLRGGVFIFGFLHEVPIYRKCRPTGSVPAAMALAIMSVMAGLVVIAIWPMRALTYLHVVFISGVGLLILNVGARVMFGHSGNDGMLARRSVSSRWITGLVVLAMATRVSADLLPRMQLSHYAYAAITWLVITAIWLSVYGSLLNKVPDAGESSGRGS